MSEEIYRWPRRALAGDYLRSGIGFGLSFLFFLLIPPRSIAFFAFLILTVIFGLYLAQTALRARMVLTLLPEGLAVTGFFGNRLIRWQALDHFALRYYALRREKGAGWMDLKLGSGGYTVAIDDRLDGFRSILERSWQAARERDIGISSSTYANLTAAGLLAKTPV
jgi:hypothetical protein